ncbi:13588_t:CDS:2 [Gigaspora margarita]|uniref:13588_t:CDS:1 n=1 Tax=Gigaspora margarita TaxID=4874 RepID=A0ABN7UB44_GIGMA|nr:13588_t:CDS:2 [Gigaspora margarita]
MIFSTITTTSSNKDLSSKLASDTMLVISEFLKNLREFMLD